MDDTDFSVFGKKSKHDKADASMAANQYSPATAAANYEAVPSESVKGIITSRPTDQDTYNNCTKTGIALIFNHKDVKGQKQRVGTEKDRDDIKATLANFGFEVLVYNDLTFAKVNETLKDVAKMDHSNNDCFLIVVMSHGAEGRVYASDMAYPVERLWNPFLGNECPTLVNKPKLFFIQACRGMNLDKPTVFMEFAPMSLNSEAAPITYAIPSTADMLVFYSTFEKFYSFRNVENGSWFIQSLCNVLDSAVRNEAATPQGAELLRLLTAVNRQVAYNYQSNASKEELNQMKEMPNFMSTLTKTFYLRVKRN